MRYSILVVDDDRPFHIFIKKALEGAFISYHANDAQEGINILSEKNINLVLADWYMPGLSGLELLQALKKDGDKKRIPVLILTNLPTIVKKEQALKFGAADVIDKSEIITNRDKLLDAIHSKLFTGFPVSNGKSNINQKKKNLVAELMKVAPEGDFSITVRALCSQLKKQFDVDYLSLWIVNGSSPILSLDTGSIFPKEESAEVIPPEIVKKIKDGSKPYLCNNILSGKEGIMYLFSKKYDLNAEIGVPLFCITESELLVNGMKIPDDARIFGFVSLKRNKLFTTEEYMVISSYLLQMGAVLWRFFIKNEDYLFEL